MPSRSSMDRASPTRASDGRRPSKCCGTSRRRCGRAGSWCLALALDQAIPETPRRLDRHLGDESLLQFLAETANVHVDQARVAPRLVAPNPDQQIVAREP